MKNGMRFTAMLTAFLLTAGMMTGCGGSTEESSTDASTSSVAETIEATDGKNAGIKTDNEVLTPVDGTETSETEEQSETSTEETADSTDSGTEADESTSEDTTEEQSVDADTYNTIKAIAENGYKAAMDSNYGEAVKYVDLDAMWYLTTGEWIMDEDLVAELEKANAEGGEDASVSVDGSFTTSLEELEDLEFTDVIPCTDEEVKEINDFIILLGEDSEYALDDFVITDAYKLPVTYSNMSEGEQALLGTEDAPRMYVIEYNGEYKLDMCVTLLMEMFNAFSEIDWGSAETTIEE